MNGVSKLTLTEDVSVITFNKLSAEPSNVAKILNQFSEEGINIDMISQTVLSLTVFSEDLMKALSLCTQLKDSVSDLRPLVSSGNCKLQLYGEEMRSMHGVAAKAIDVIASAGEEIYLITTSEVDISVLLPRDRVHEAVSALEKAFGVACQ